MGYLHEYKYLWKKCQDPEIIRAAWLKLRKGKTTRKEVIKIDNNYEYYANKIQSILSRTYPGSSEPFTPRFLRPKVIFEHGKERLIYRPPIFDQWIHHIIVYILAHIVIRFSYKYSCGSMPNRGGLYGKRRLAKFIRKTSPKYFLKCDIRHFFNNIRLSIVLRELRTFVNDEYLFYLIERVFLQFQKGLPLGFYISQWFANFVLSKLDWDITNIAKRESMEYIRYMDDLVVCGNNKRILNKILVRIKRGLGKLKLKLKTNWQIARFDFNGIGRRIDFMGFLFTRKATILRKNIMIRSLRYARKLHRRQIIAVKQAQSMVSRVGWYKHTSTAIIYHCYICRYISIKSMKDMISKHQRRLNNENRMATGTALSSA